AAGVRVSIDRRRLSALVELHHSGVVVLGDQQVAALVGEDPIGVVAADLPYLCPLLPRGNDAGDRRDRVVGRRRWERRCGGSVAGRALTRTRAARPTTARGRRRLAAGDERLVAGILRRLRARPGRQRDLRKRDRARQDDWNREEDNSLH